MLYRWFGLVEPHCDPDGTYGGRLCPRNQAQLLYWISWVGMATGLIGIWNGWLWLGLGTCIGSVFAQLYWSDPTFSWRRNLDITWIQVLMWTHMVAAWFSPVFWPYLAIQLTGVGFFGLSWMFMLAGSSWAATLMHAAVHVCAEVSVLMLYLSGGGATGPKVTA